MAPNDRINGVPSPKSGSFTSGPKVPAPPAGGSGKGAGGCLPVLALAAGALSTVAAVLGPVVPS